MHLLLIGTGVFLGVLWYRGGASTSAPLSSVQAGWNGLVAGTPLPCIGCAQANPGAPPPTAGGYPAGAPTANAAGATGAGSVIQVGT